MAPEDVLNGRGGPNSASVPVFNCIVYLRRGADGSVHARVANLAGIESTAASEREALGKAVAMFKQRVAENLGRGEPICWLDPPMAPEPDAQQRLIAVHL